VNRNDQEVAQTVAVKAPYPSLTDETRHAVETACAAFHLNRKPQTLLVWACLERGPIRPTRINGRLAWKTSDLCRILGVEP
jgi:hypothetical protein